MTVPWLRVLDLSQTLPGAYCTKLLVDAWADVIKVEPPGGDPLRLRSPFDADAEHRDSALFSYLCASKRSVAGSPADVLELAAGADLVVEDLAPGTIDVEALRAKYPSLVVVSITPFGRKGDWADRPANEFVLQGWSGSLALRGLPDRPPLQAGGRIGEWSAGAYAAMGGLAAAMRARRTGRGEHVDVSILESMCLIFLPDQLLEDRIGTEPLGRTRNLELPGITPTSDGHVGIYVWTGQQFQDLMTMIERPDLVESAWSQAAVRFARRDEFLEMVHKWSLARSTEEALELGAAFRIPMAPLGDGATIPSFDHFEERQIFVRNPAGFIQPRVPYRLGDSAPQPFGPAPRVEDIATEPLWAPRDDAAEQSAADAQTDDRALPLAGIRVIDLTAFWAGPSATDLLGALGCDVVKIESIKRPDGIRANSRRRDLEQWWEYGAMYHVSNRNKRGITLDLAEPRGNALLRQLIATADVVIENFTPRVMENLGLGWESIHALNPRVLMVRMPGFGLTGPWRDRGAFGPTIEQVSGMASVTGYENEPTEPRGMADPVAGVHTAFSVLVGLEARQATGEGLLIEVPMVECALNISAEVVLEYSAYGNVLRPNGNRSLIYAPQGVYQCAGDDRWVAFSVETDEHWQELRTAMDSPQWAESSEFDTVAGRRAAHDQIDGYLATWCAAWNRDELVEALANAGIPAAPVVRGADVPENPRLLARGFFEALDHPMVGTQLLPGLPFRFSSCDQGWLRTPSPTLGQHNEEVLCGELGLSLDELDELRNDLVIGDRVVGG